MQIKISILDKIAILLFVVLLVMASFCLFRSHNGTSDNKNDSEITSTDNGSQINYSLKTQEATF